MAQPSLDALSYYERLAVDEIRRQIEETSVAPHTPWQTPPRHLDWSLADVLVAYLTLRESHRGYANPRYSLPMLAAVLALPCAELPSSIDQIDDFARRYPEKAPLVVREVLTTTTRWSADVFVSDAPGRLTRQIYDACGFHLTAATRAPSRTTYLRDRVCAHAEQLTAPESDLANTLAPDWAGTLDELLETACLLRLPDGSRAARAPTDCRGRSLRHRQ